MAKSNKISFRDSVALFESLIGQIDARRYAPIYLLMGEEGYFIDVLSDRLAETVLDETEKSFNQIVMYGRDTDEGTIINYARQLPMMGNRQVIIVREAQQLRKIDKLALYASKPSSSTILVLCHKGKSVDKRSQLYRLIQEKGIVFESLRPRDYEIGPWLEKFMRARGCSIEPKALTMLTDHLGTDIAKISNETDKLLTRLPVGTREITARHIEENIGISKDFNNFELTKAISEKNMARALLIADHFRQNPKENPLTVTIGTIFAHFQKIFLLNYKRWQVRHRKAPAPTEEELCRLLKLPTPFFLNEYRLAADRYPNKKVFSIFGFLREYDMKSKGIGGGSADNGELLRELLMKIFMT